MKIGIYRNYDNTTLNLMEYCGFIINNNLGEGVRQYSKFIDKDDRTDIVVNYTKPGVGNVKVFLTHPPKEIYDSKMQKSLLADVFVTTAPEDECRDGDFERILKELDKIITRVQ